MSRRSRAAASDVEQALAATGGASSSVFLFSGVINVLALTGSMFMLQVYDRVLTSRSVATLVALAAITLLLYAFQGVLEVIRSRVLNRLSRRIDHQVMPHAFEALRLMPLRGRSPQQALQPLRDLETLRGFKASPAQIALYDLPWIPIYLIFVFLLHPWLGLLVILGAGVLVGLTAMSEAGAREPTHEAIDLAGQKSQMSEAVRRNAEVLKAMGFSSTIYRRFAGLNGRYLTAQERLADLSGGLGGLGRVLRLMLQSAILGLGAYLVLRDQLSAGGIIAASIAAGRALAPIDQAIGNWRGFVAFRQARTRLKEALTHLPPATERLPLPKPHRFLTAEGVFVAAPGSDRLVVQNVSFQLNAGDGLAIIGPSAAGKSTLLRALVGVWPPFRGKVRLDGAPLDQWIESDLGRHIGYLPQDIELFDGTISENIARFDPAAEAEGVIRASQAAGVHEMILRLPEGYASRVGEGGTALSAGQRQRIGLARALYGDPFLVVLDEPNSNLDADGEQALTRAIGHVRQRGGIVVLVAHRPSALASINLVAVLRDGQLSLFGPKDEVIRKLNAPAEAAPVTAAPVMKIASER